MAKSFNKLRDGMSELRREKVAAQTEELLASLPLHEIRLARKLSQEDIAARLDVKQAAVSKVEHRADIYISTLRRHIEAMGGTLIIQAEFPEGCYQISSFDKIESDT